MAEAANPLPVPTGQSKTPSDFLKSIRGKPVIVKLNSGVDYRGEEIYRVSRTVHEPHCCSRAVVAHPMHHQQQQKQQQQQANTAALRPQAFLHAWMAT
jgi:hypothetical protein